MKLRLSSSFFLLALTTPAFASPPITSVTVASPGNLYVGIWGGGGSSNNFNGSQYGTVFITEAAGGPLAVNAFGQLNDQNPWFFGAQLGYQAQEIFLNSPSEWTFSPAIELEAYWTNKNTFSGALHNNTVRLDEHDFSVSYPMRRTVLLVNSVLNVNHSRLLVQPYIGLGIGNAIVKISDASSLQVNPVEAGINHYNANASDTNSTFAGQIKLGLGYDINDYIGIFAEYRWLYLANTLFVLGSTVYPTHSETSSWQVKLDAQKYNLGSVGVRFSW